MVADVKLTNEEREQRSQIRSEIEYIQWLLDKDLVKEAVQALRKFADHLES